MAEVTVVVVRVAEVMVAAVKEAVMEAAAMVEARAVASYRRDRWLRHLPGNQSPCTCSAECRLCTPRTPLISFLHFSCTLWYPHYNIYPRCRRRRCSPHRSCYRNCRRRCCKNRQTHRIVPCCTRHKQGDAGQGFGCARLGAGADRPFAIATATNEPAPIMYALDLAWPRTPPLLAGCREHG